MFAALALLSALHAAAPAAVDTGTALRPAPTDTTTTLRFAIAAQPLTRALGEFARQGGVRVQVDAAAAATLSAPALAGSYTAPEALRRLLAGTGMSGRFVDLETVQITGSGVRSHTLTALTVVGVRSRGYGATRTSSATRTDTPLRDAPQAVTVVTRDLIADQSMQGMADLVRFVPGVTMGQGEGNRDAPTIRGQSSTADFFVDGVRDDVQYIRDLYNAERVEALKGANAMVFGRGGGGGVLNRVTKEAQWDATRTLTFEGGSFLHRRGTLDLGQGLGSTLALRLNGMYQNSEGFRDRAQLERFGVNPTLALVLGATTVRAGYEYFSDDRTADRGIPSYQGRPATTGARTFFGNPDSSYVQARVHAATALVEHSTSGGLTVRNRTRWADYDKFYQNSLPGAVSADGSQVTLSAYGNQTDRGNLFNQTDLTYTLGTGTLRHTLLAGAELSRQETSNFRQTGYYNNTTTAFAAPFASPTVSTPITFRQSASDADNRSEATVVAVYAQDQLALGDRWQAILGLRLDRFQMDFHNNRTGEELDRTDQLLSPRAGLVFKPVEAASLYGSYSVSFLPSSGDQFGSLTATTETLEPEQFTSYEVGGKWDLHTGFSLSAALFRLDRTNTSAPDPVDPTLTVQTGSQRTTGMELNAAGNVTRAWQVVGGLSMQRAKIVSTTRAAAAGARVPLVPERTFSLWNRFQLHPALGVGVGVVHRSDMFGAIDNTVTIPGYTRADAALFARLGRTLSAQVNVENLLDERYFDTSHGNNNIMPGASRSVRLSLTARR